jgi:hypothetical protein
MELYKISKKTAIGKMDDKNILFPMKIYNFR